MQAALVVIHPSETSGVSFEAEIACRLQDITEKKHRKLLASNRHLRYMWIPYTDTVVVVTNNPIAEVAPPPSPFRPSVLKVSQTAACMCRNEQGACIYI